MKALNVAIYSGEIPSTTFIENLILSVPESEINVYLFGYITKHIQYRKRNIFIYSTPAPGWKTIPFVLYNKLKLRIQSRNNFNKLQNYIKSKGKGKKHEYLLWSKYLPIVLNLPQVFHLQWAKSLEEWFFLKELFDVKIVLSLRGAHIYYSPLANEKLADSYRKYFPLIDGFHAVSNDILKIAALYSTKLQNSKVIYTGIDNKSIPFQNLPTKFNQRNPVKIISVGRFHWVKGYHIAINAMRILEKQDIPFEYTIIANGGNEEEIKYIINEHALNKKIKILSGMSHDKVISSMHDSDIMLLPSVEEGIANVVLEAMACGTLVLSSDCCGMSEVVTDETGFTFRNRDAEDLASRIMQIQNTDELELSKIKANARAYVVSNHTIAQLGTKMSELYINTLRS